MADATARRPARDRPASTASRSPSTTSWQRPSAGSQSVPSRMPVRRSSTRLRSPPGIARSGVGRGAGRTSGAVSTTAFAQVGVASSSAKRPASSLGKTFQRRSCHAAPTIVTDNEQQHRRQRDSIMVPRTPPRGQTSSRRRTTKRQIRRLRTASTTATIEHDAPLPPRARRPPAAGNEANSVWSRRPWRLGSRVEQPPQRRVADYSSVARAINTISGAAARYAPLPNLRKGLLRVFRNILQKWQLGRIVALI